MKYLVPAGGRSSSQSATSRTVGAAQTSQPSPPPFTNHPVDPYEIKSILSERLRDEVLLPHCPPGAGSRHPTLDPPAWTLWHEAWYQTIHPDAWTPLIDDDDADWELAEDLSVRLGLYEVPAPDDVLGTNGLSRKEWNTSMEVYDGIMDRIIERYARVFALRYVRDGWILHQKELFPGLCTRDFVGMLPLGSLSSRPAYAVGSVWPLPTAPPPGAKVVEDFLIPYSPFHSLSGKEEVSKEAKASKEEEAYSAVDKAR
ncbi:hypothetical protein JCM10213_005404 [Rhodosporidiobolus nylandii]